MGSIAFPTQRNARCVEYIEDSNECWNVTSHSNGGAPGKDYPQAFLDGKERHLHRVSYEFFNGSIAEGMCVMHICDNRRCINPKHLKLGTISDNNKDMSDKNRNRKGVRHHWAKLDEDKVKEIRRLYANGTLQRIIADRFGVKQAAISEIVRHKTWAYLGDEA